MQITQRSLRQAVLTALISESRSYTIPPTLQLYVDSLGFELVMGAWQNAGGDLDRVTDELEEYMGDLHWDEAQKAARTPKG